MSVRSMTKTLIERAGILTASFFCIAWLGHPVALAATANQRTLAGLRASLSTQEVEAMLQEWGTPFSSDPDEQITSFDNRPVNFQTIRLQRGPSPFGPVLDGILRLVDGKLFWVEIHVDLPLEKALDHMVIGPPTAANASSRFWRLPIEGGWAWTTGNASQHHVTFAFHRALREAAIVSDEEWTQTIAAFQAEIYDAIRLLSTKSARRMNRPSRLHSDRNSPDEGSPDSGKP